MEEKDCIIIRGARVNNLKNVDIDIPRGQFVVITGLSGSGKSSLAFDTLYAEGQRRYVESLSSYARQFLGQMNKPECDFIKGIPPAIAIEQKVNNRNPRSTVGTSTEIYEYFKLLYARIGKTYSPISGNLVKKNRPEDLVECMRSRAIGTRFTLLAPIKKQEGRNLKEQLSIYLQQGFTRIWLEGDIKRIEEYTPNKSDKPCLLIDRLTVSDSPETISRLLDSAETAFYEGDGCCMMHFTDEETPHIFSIRFEADGMTFEEPTEQMFSFNSPIGACPDCEGFGRIVGIDENLVIPNKSLSIYDGAVFCWRGEKMGQWKNEFCLRAPKDDFPIFEPYYNLTQEQKEYLWHSGPFIEEYGEGICIDNFFKMVRENQYKIQYRVMLARYRGKPICPTCHGTRLKKEASYVKIGGKSITELVEMPVVRLKEFFDNLKLDEHDTAVAKRILIEIRNRIECLMDVGLGYLTMNRLSNTLSGGESQRINLVTSLGSNLVGSLYILDEPSIGLHSRDTERLINVLYRLRDLGNTVVVVEHDEDIIRAADYIIDVGPRAGSYGGNIVFSGSNEVLQRMESDNNSYTVRYLTGTEIIPLPEHRRTSNNYITIKGARENNLKGIDINIPLNLMTVVSGVSGSGKSTLVRDILYRSIKRHLGETGEAPGQHDCIEGAIKSIAKVEFIDQNPIGKSSRSNPVTYLKVYDEIRHLFAQQPLAKQMNYGAGHFSFNSDGGRCEECKGEGVITVSMQFMADLQLECEACKGRRFKKEILEVKFHEKSIYDILEMTVGDAINFFQEHGQQRIANNLQPLQDVGLAYIKLGQSSSTLSGGENQRVKLAYYLSQQSDKPTMFIFDEPTTGLHFHDIKKLLDSFRRLLSRGHTLVIIEHNMDVIKCADYLIDLGPEGGENGGYLVAAGTPEEVAACEASYTGKYLKMKLSQDSCG
ncbi:MAG: excinuclease ABC subunit UvrA [Bacteroidaceae bacterium]|nr:excinuclease ABC subunit UvrA [Bacteroidaceae bacterium]